MAVMDSTALPPPSGNLTKMDNEPKRLPGRTEWADVENSLDAPVEAELFSLTSLFPELPLTPGAKRPGTTQVPSSLGIL